MRIIPRRIELHAIRYSGWKMLYGRRKTGKTFLVEHFTNYDEFFFVNKDGTVHDRLKGDKMTYHEFIRFFSRLIEEGKKLSLTGSTAFPRSFLMCFTLTPRHVIAS